MLYLTISQPRSYERYSPTKVIHTKSLITGLKRSPFTVTPRLASFRSGWTQLQLLRAMDSFGFSSKLDNNNFFLCWSWALSLRTDQFLYYFLRIYLEGLDFKLISNATQFDLRQISLTMLWPLPSSSFLNNFSGVNNNTLLLLHLTFLNF